MQEDDAGPHDEQTPPQKLPTVPIPPQQRQQLLGKLPADLEPVFQAAADTLHSTADAQVRLCTALSICILVVAAKWLMWPVLLHATQR